MKSLEQCLAWGQHYKSLLKANLQISPDNYNTFNQDNKLIVPVLLKKGLADFSFDYHSLLKNISHPPKRKHIKAIEGTLCNNYLIINFKHLKRDITKFKNNFTNDKAQCTVRITASSFWFCSKDSIHSTGIHSTSTYSVTIMFQTH